MKKTENALRWIVGIFEKHAIPFQISGGYAAKLYGSDRPLADLDFDVPEEYFQKLIPEVKQYIVYGPQQYKDDSWDLLLMTLNYNGQEIDIAGAYEAKLFDKSTQTWITNRVDLSKALIKEMFGLQLPVMSKEELITYKKKLNRDVDEEDVRQLID
jgi:hypothetical protein